MALGNIEYSFAAEKVTVTGGFLKPPPCELPHHPACCSTPGLWGESTDWAMGRADNADSQMVAACLKCDFADLFTAMTQVGAAPSLTSDAGVVCFRSLTGRGSDNQPPCWPLATADRPPSPAAARSGS